MNFARATTAVLEEIANRFLRLDTRTLCRLGDLDGKSIRLCYDGVLSVYVLPFEGGLRLRNEIDGEPDVTISGNLPAFARMLMGEIAPGVMAAADMQIKGDMELGQHIKGILDDIEIDWEEHASRYLGDVLAHKLGNVAHTVHDWRVQAHENMAQTAVEFLQQESRLSPFISEVEEYLQGVDTVRNDADRLAQRIQHLKDSHGV
ncbi:MAG: SCP2 sterol-binding domain-containing protein [Gammaproteobacteria bacterium]|nr:MAG: SCP2 sterol-binding domain-containing protein [Gammaproteobacteria bacterium]